MREKLNSELKNSIINKNPVASYVIFDASRVYCL